MNKPPDELDGAKVILWSLLSPEDDSPTAAIAICRYAGAADFYLFYCDSSWEVIGDTSHRSIDDATDEIFHWDGTIGARLWQLHLQRLRLLKSLQQVYLRWSVVTFSGNRVQSDTTT